MTICFNRQLMASSEVERHQAVWAAGLLRPVRYPRAASLFFFLKVCFQTLSSAKKIHRQKITACSRPDAHLHTSATFRPAMVGVETSDRTLHQEGSSKALAHPASAGVCGHT